MGALVIDGHFVLFLTQFINPSTEKYGISWSQVGRIEVGTETIIDKSKARLSTCCNLVSICVM